jgi:hypothetical protein
MGNDFGIVVRRNGAMTRVRRSGEKNAKRTMQKLGQHSVNFNRDVFLFSNANEGSGSGSDSVAGHSGDNDSRQFRRQSVQRDN